MAKTKTRPKVTSRSVKPSQFGTQVKAESDLKFGPQDSSLRTALSDAGTARQQAYAAAGGVRSAIQDAAAKAAPQLKSAYGSAGRVVDQVSQSLGAVLSGAGVLGGAAARDAAGTKERLAESLANAEADTTARSRDAASGEAFARQNADVQYNTARTRIRQQQTDLAGQRGSFAQARSGELTGAEEGRLVTQRGQDTTADTASSNRAAAGKRAAASLGETHRHNVQSEKTAKQRLKKQDSGVASPANVEKARTAVNRALDAARSVSAEVTSGEKAKGVKMRDRGSTGKILVNGRGGQTIANDPKTGDPLANPIKIPGVKAQDQLYASVALDMLYDGRLSRSNQARLAQLGLTPKMLGLTPAYSTTHSDTQLAPAGRTGRGQRRPT